MKVIHVLNHFLPDKIAGTEIYVWALCKELSYQGIETIICIPNYRSIENTQYVYDSLKVYKYSENSIVDRDLIMGFRHPDGLSNFVSFLEYEKPDLLHFHELAGSNGITLHHVKAAKSLGLKTLMTFHLAGYSCKTGALVYKEKKICDGEIKLNKCSSCYMYSRGFKKSGYLVVKISMFLNYLNIDSTRWNNSLGTALGVVNIFKKLKVDLNTLILNTDRVVVISDWYKRILIANGINETKIDTIQQGLPLDAGFKIKINKSISKPLRLMFLGRISKFKGLHLLIDAIHDIPEDLVELSVFGDTDDIQYEKILREKTRFKQNVYWNGKLEQRDVLLTMQNHDILCLCSTFSEMSPLVIQEAFASGIPVIASNVYGNAAQIEHEQNGLLFRFNDVRDLSDQIYKCINEPELISKMANKIIIPRSFSDVATDYVTIYKNILI